MSRRNRVLLLAVGCTVSGAVAMRSIDTSSYVFGAFVALLLAALLFEGWRKSK